jgi:hypothetical protein
MAISEHWLSATRCTSLEMVENSHGPNTAEKYGLRIGPLIFPTPTLSLMTPLQDSPPAPPQAEIVPNSCLRSDKVRSTTNTYRQQTDQRTAKVGAIWVRVPAIVMASRGGFCCLSHLRTYFYPPPPSQISAFSSSLHSCSALAGLPSKNRHYDRCRAHLVEGGHRLSNLPRKLQRF